MREIDASASEPLEVLIERAGAAVARAAVQMLGGSYGKRVVVIAGKGNNGADGRVAARRLAVRGVHVDVLDAAHLPSRVPECDLVIDAAYGIGFRGLWSPPEIVGTPVLAVDIPTGVDARTGECRTGAITAARTVTFAALKPGLLVPPGSLFVGELEVADVGLDVSRAHIHLVEQADVSAWVPQRPADAHKWRAAVWVVAGSPEMFGAARLAAAAAQRAGAGMVYLSTPGAGIDPLAPTESVSQPLPSGGWAAEVLNRSERFHAFVVGPGLGRLDVTAGEVKSFVAQTERPVVIDGDGLFALAWGDREMGALLRRRSAPTVLTPHDGEYALLTGHRPGADRIEAARRLATDTGAVVLLKGPVTIVANPNGSVHIVNAGDDRLATAGTGDVLSGMVGALLAQGLPAMEAASAGAWIHGTAARRGPARGLIASDVVGRIPAVLESL